MLVEIIHRITGPHLLQKGTGAALWICAVDSIELQRIWERVAQGCSALAWDAPQIKYNDMGASISICAPVDQLYVACAVLEWALEEASWNEEQVRNEEEENLSLRNLYEHCVALRLSFTVDEDAFCYGYGKNHRRYSLDALPQIHELPQEKSIPIVGITGTNGKTTTTRMLASIAKVEGFCVGATSSDGVVVNEELVVSGDWTGSEAARKVLRHSNVEFAVLETARGGLLRRGVVIPNMDVVGITNVSPDHYGSWGINSLSMLQRAKLSIIHGLKHGGILVLNEEHIDLYEMFVREYAPIRPDIAVVFFSLHNTDRIVHIHNGHIIVNGSVCCCVEEIPLTINGFAKYNIENAVMASTLAFCAGLSVRATKEGLQRLHPNPKDSQGRTNIFTYREGTVILDFAHNEHGVQVMVDLVKAMNPKRSFMVIGQAGDRDEDLLAGMSYAAASLQCDLYFLKHLKKHNETRSAEETLDIIKNKLLEAGVSPKQIQICDGEIDAAEKALSILKSGDILLLLAHSYYAQILDLIEKG